MTQTIAPEATIGEVQLDVSNLQRSLDYYEKALGFQVLRREGNMAVVGVADRPLLVLHEKPGAKPYKGTTGLYHFAVLLPNRKALARLIYHLAEAEIEVAGVADHGVSEAIYMTDPDGIGIELYRDRRRNEWPRDDLGRLQMGTEELDLDDLLLELRGGVQPWNGLPEGTTIGHVHLHVANLAEAERFYRQVLGFELMQRYGSGALFVSAGGYHHHIGMNTWAGEGAPPPPPDAVGLRWFEIVLPSPEAVQAILKRLDEAGVTYEQQGQGYLVRDPSKNGMVLRS